MSSNVWFTADTHFNHSRIVEFFRKQFVSVQEMNERIIERWNAVVARGDRVYHLGDFALGSGDAAREIADRLNGNIYLIRGNHERTAETPACRERFVWIKDYEYLKVGEQRIVLCHYAMRTWRSSHRGAWMLHGHSHGSLDELPHRSFDVGVDCWDFSPVSFEDVRSKMETKLFVPVDHHIEDEATP